MQWDWLVQGYLAGALMNILEFQVIETTQVAQTKKKKKREECIGKGLVSWKKWLVSDMAV